LDALNHARRLAIARILQTKCGWETGLPDGRRVKSQTLFIMLIPSKRVSFFAPWRLGGKNLFPV